MALEIGSVCALLHATEGESSLIFGKTKYGVEKLGKQLSKLGFTVGTLHGNKSQRAREEVLTAFRRGQVQTLLATNVAARGLDITGIDQVINYELPESSDLFTHRIGRTGRMGRQGKAITLLVPSDVSKDTHILWTISFHIFAGHEHTAYIGRASGGCTGVPLARCLFGPGLDKGGSRNPTSGADRPKSR